MQTLCFDCLLSSVLQFGDHFPHAAAQCLELGRAPDSTLCDLYHRPFIAVLLCVGYDRRLGRRWQRLTMTDQVRPSHELVERPAQLPAQMAGDSRGCARQNQQRQHPRDCNHPHRSLGEKTVAARLLDRRPQLALVGIDGAPLRRR